MLEDELALTKKQRIEVWKKSGGKCWYCGCELPERGWHADHFLPIIRESTGKCLRGYHDAAENMVPSCASCNLFKATFDIESFRREIEAQKERVRNASSGFRIAERMGLIEVKDKPVVFWFETQGF